MAIKPCDCCLEPSCHYSSEVYKWPQFGRNGSICCCCYARNV